MIREYAAFRERTQDMCPEEIKHAQARREQYVRLVTMSLSPERYPSGAYEKRTSIEVLIDTFIWSKLFLVLSRKQILAL